jgi:predicted O-methyltransferase YrrM
MTLAEQVIVSQDFSHPATTSKEHILELYHAAIECGAQKILELGSHKGISTVALALASKFNKGFVCSVDLCDEIPTEERVTYWNSFEHNLIKNIFPYKEDSARYLADEDNPKFNFIFHDAAHGDQVLPEYYACWQKTNSVFAMHDFDQISNKNEFIGNLNPRKYVVSRDDRGRQLAIFYK